MELDVMTDPKKFFDENVRLLPSAISAASPDQQREYNLNRGLRAMTQMLEQIQADQRRLQQEIQRVEQIVRGLR